ncbi:response regulator transcription factor [Humibacter soli]
MSIRVVIADDQAIVREGFRAILERDPEIEVVGEASDGATAVRQARALSPDVIVMDVRMPGVDGIRATEDITADPELQHVKVLVVTTYDVDANVFAALRAGASGFLLKDLEPSELRRAVHVVAAGDALLAPGATRSLIASFVASPAPGTAATSVGLDDGAAARLAGLTEREREIVALVAKGLGNDEIAGRLVISPTTVKTHVSHALIKLGARDRAQLVVFAYESGLVG